MESIYWLILFIVLLIIEIVTLGLTTIWFAGGALVGFIACLLGAGIQVQVYLFIGISLVLLIFTRPAVKKYLNRQTVKTNAEGLIGRTAVVKERVDNRRSEGIAVLNGQDWTARAVCDEDILEPGEEVWVKEIRGVKLIVARKIGGNEK